MKYCQNTTASHSLSKRFPQHLKQINIIIHEETNNENLNKINKPFNNEVALQLDKAKVSSEDENIQKLKSMDMVLGMNDNGTYKMLLVDFKLNCFSTKSLSQNDCRNKIRCSKIILFGGGILVHNTYLFIFNNEYLLKAEARHDISRKLNNLPVEVLNINEFHVKYF